jgi:hypothetical protein
LVNSNRLMINFTIDKLNCFFNCSKRVDERVLQIEINELSRLEQTTNEYTFVNMVLGKIMHTTHARTGFLYKAMPGDSTSYKTLAVYGISVNEVLMTKNIINIPLFHHSVFVGTLGLGLNKFMSNTSRFLEDLEPILNYIAKYLLEHTFNKET